MTQPSVDEPVLPAAAVAATPANIVGRIAAAAAGLVLLVGGVLVSFGAVLLGALSMALVSYVQRRRGRRLGRGGNWIVATASVMVVMLFLAAFAAETLPAGTWQQVKRTTDSASVASQKTPPPAWLERVAPGSAQRAARQPRLPESMRTIMMIWGAIMGIGLLAGAYGTIAWAGGMLIGFAGTGRWPGGTDLALDARGV